MIGFIALIIAFSYLILRILFVASEKEALSEDGKYFDLWGKVILAALGITFVIFFNVGYEVIKWFWIFFIVAVLGFQSYVDWKYLKESKRYVVSLSVLIFGVILAYFLL